MIKVNQPFTITLTISGGLSSTSSATIEYESPAGATGSVVGSIDETAGTVSADIPANTVDAEGTWRFVAVVTYTDADVVPSSAKKVVVHNRYA